MSDERRDSSRDRSFARIFVSVEGRVGYVADVSDSGFKGLFVEPFEPELGRDLLVGVSFAELGLSAFVIEATARWSRISQGAMEVGFEIRSTSPSSEEAGKFAIIRDYYSGGRTRST